MFISMGMFKRKAAEDRFSSEGSLLTQGITSNFLDLKRKVGRRKARVGGSKFLNHWLSSQARDFIAVYP